MFYVEHFLIALERPKSLLEKILSELKSKLFYVEQFVCTLESFKNTNKKLFYVEQFFILHKFYFILKLLQRFYLFL
jgi:hypothetical protein